MIVVLSKHPEERQMHVVTRQRLQEFWQFHPDAERPLKAWLALVRLKRYSSPPAVREDFASASFLGQWRTVFNIGGNKYRLVVDIRYDLGRIYIRHVLTHEEYTRRTQEGSL
jgi:mRNA interferase HigB